jgi:hypothetical protein
MSQQGLQRTQQLLQVIGAQLPSIAQASTMLCANDLREFVYGTVQRSGTQFTREVIPALNALIDLIEPIPNPEPPQAPPDTCLPPLDDRIADT